MCSILKGQMIPELRILSCSKRNLRYFSFMLLFLLLLLLLLLLAAAAVATASVRDTGAGTTAQV